MGHTPESIRNVVLFGHGGSGKTSIIDALAHLTKVSNRLGNPGDGTSICDSEPEEKERKQTLTSHLFSVPYEDVRLNFIDTPGHADFMAEAITAMQVVETGILVIDAASHLTFHARQLWQEAAKAGLGRAIVVTHPDSENADFDRLVAELQEVFGDTVVPMTYPDASGPAFSEVHDVQQGQGPMAAAYDATLQERVAEADDEILESFLETGELPHDVIERFFARAVVTGKLTPLFCVSSPNELGLRKLCHVIASEFPSPVSFGMRNAGKPGTGSFGETVSPDPDGPLLGQVFKILSDPYVGRLTYLRCVRGTLKVDDTMHGVHSGTDEKVGGLLAPQGVEMKPVDNVGPGDIFAIGKIESFGLGETVCAAAAQLELPWASFPGPTYSLAVEPSKRGDEQKISQALDKIAAEDPTFRVHRDETTAELIVSGNSPLHIEIALARLKRRYGVDTLTHVPTIPYKETISGRSEGHHRHKKQSGGRGQFAEVYLRGFATERGSGFQFIDSVVGGAIPRQFIPEVEKGIKQFMAKGPIAGFPVVDVGAEVYDGKFHDVDSDQLSFQLAGRMAFHDAFSKAKPQLLEPIMDVEVKVPERFTGDVAGSLSTIRGRMQGMEVVEGIQTIKAQVPLKELQDFSTQLRSMTAGEGSFTMEPSHYEPVPANIQAEIVAARKRAAEERKK